MFFIKTFWAIFLPTNIARRGTQEFYINHSRALFFWTEFKVGIVGDEVKSLYFFIDFNFLLRKIHVKLSWLVDFCLAILLRAVDNFIAWNFGVNMLLEAFSTKLMIAWAYLQEIIFRALFQTDIALANVFFRFIEFFLKKGFQTLPHFVKIITR